ncbi:hypothetical protein [Nocardia cyriacigeorgica]|uniref:hypothetical protein n=1 Tax=Nocardia cyriacigeorgica TaxID=135487 RepID=UPI002455AF81|nr:hypothetical protein [Nocardia cyriacigeorgica]
MGSHNTTGTCTTCGRPAFPHPYRHPITTTAAPTPPRELTDRERLAALASELMIARLDADTERQRADKWRETAANYCDIREWLRSCDDTPEGHTEFYRWASHIIWPDTYPAPETAPEVTPEQRVADAQAAAAAAQRELNEAWAAAQTKLAAFSEGAQ